MKKTILTLVLTLIGIHTTFAQIGIGTTSPDASAQLELQSTAKGFLPPRMDTNARNNINSPAEGLTIYNTDENCLQWYDTNGWYDGCSGVTYAMIASLDCASATNNGTLTDGQSGASVDSEIAYTGGNGQSHSGQVVTSTGVTGLTATLDPGTLTNGTGSLTYTITGTPTSDGTASFAISIGGQTCTLTRTIDPILTVTGAGGEIWMDRNLGASQVATSSTDSDSYGDLYQWGRAADGHQTRSNVCPADCFAGNSTLGVPNFYNDESNDWYGKFITVITVKNWLQSSVTNLDDLWQGLNGVNNPCPGGYRLPTIAEWDTEIKSWNTEDAAGALSSLLKLPYTGYRNLSDGLIIKNGTDGYYWSSTTFNEDARAVRISSTFVFQDPYQRAHAYAIRCIKD